MQIKSLKLKDCYYGNQWFDEIEHRWVYDDFVAEKDWQKGWISFDCALYNPSDDRVYLGITCFDANDVFKTYDRQTGQFVDLGYSRVADPFDAKFHRSLVKGSDGCLYAAPALLHCPDKYLEAPGAAVVKFDPATGHIEKLGVVLPHVYVQSLVLDPQQDVAYCLCFAPEYLASYNLRTGEAKTLGLLGSGYGAMAQGENIALDDRGCVWSNWSLTRAWQNEPGPDAIRLCKYDPREDRIVYFQKGLPHPDGSYGYAKAEALFNFGDGAMYASGANGSLYRIDPDSGDAEFLFTPTPDRRSRLSSLVKTEDGVAYGITGRDGKCELMQVHYKEARFEKLGHVVDADGNAMFQCHHIVATPDGVLYACENDNPYRSSYLWEITL
ncbi:MAG: hypothetical protein H8E44_19835 [Planctomycetes bacterium]|nr:hypothetical protein [Planctomycetota bacterium]MBL7037838.1 hypothetical protein [Pirellulaceae bacterium]